MGLLSQIFNHQTPNVPALTKGMLLGASGVSAPPHHTIGAMSGQPATLGSFNDPSGKGQMATAPDGSLFVADTNNRRVQRFVKNAAGVWAPDSQCSALNALGADVVLELLAIDTVRNQLHLASSAQNAVNTWIGVWDLGSWPNLTVGNRVRSYGTQAAANGSGNARQAQCLTLIGDHAVVCSSVGDYRVLKWDHTVPNGTLLAERTNLLWMGRIASDGVKYYTGSQASNSNLGLWQMNPATLADFGARLDTQQPAAGRYTRRDCLVQSVGGDGADFIYYNGRVYVRHLQDGRVSAWKTSDDLFCDEFLWPGGSSANESFGHAPGVAPSVQIQFWKMGIALGDNNRSDDMILWSQNAQNNQAQSFLTVFPLSVATATWTKNNWSAGVSTLKAIALQGTNISAEKIRLRLRKDAGAWVTVTADKLFDQATLESVGTFTAGNVLTVELWSSSWDRLDGHPTLVACHDKLTPSNISLQMFYDDTAGDVYVPQPISSFTARMSGPSALQARLG